MPIKLSHLSQRDDIMNVLIIQTTIVKLSMKKRMTYFILDDQCKMSVVLGIINCFRINLFICKYVH